MRKPINAFLTKQGKRERQPDEIAIKDPHSVAVIYVKIEDVKDYTKEDWQDFLLKLGAMKEIGWTFPAIYLIAEDKDKLFKLYIEPALRGAGLI
jgi:hypothetical protein